MSVAAPAWNRARRRESTNAAASSGAVPSTAVSPAVDASHAALPAASATRRPRRARESGTSATSPTRHRLRCRSVTSAMGTLSSARAATRVATTSRSRRSPRSTNTTMHASTSPDPANRLDDGRDQVGGDVRPEIDRVERRGGGRDQPGRCSARSPAESSARRGHRPRRRRRRGSAVHRRCRSGRPVGPAGGG